MTDWFARPIISVTSVHDALPYYKDKLGFNSEWSFNDDSGKVFVAQIDRQGAAFILAQNWPDKVGKGLIFISLNTEPETAQAGIAALDALRAEFESRGITVREGWWGYRLLVVDDPDGNQLLFNYPKKDGE